MINRLLMFCDFRDNGCPENVVLELYLSHIEKCGYNKIKCRYNRCDKMILLKDKDQHENKDCDFREQLCMGRCGLMIPVCMFESHDCYEELQRFNREKSEMVAKLQEKVKELNDMTKKLQQEVDKLKRRLQRRHWSFGSWDSDSQYTDSMYNYISGSSDSEHDSDLSDQIIPLTVTSINSVPTITTTTASSNGGFREYVIYPSRRPSTPPVIQNPWPIYSQTRSNRYVFNIRSPSPVRISNAITRTATAGEILDLSHPAQQEIVATDNITLPSRYPNSDHFTSEQDDGIPADSSIGFTESDINEADVNSPVDDDEQDGSHHSDNEISHHSDHTVYSLSDSGSDRSPARWWRSSRSSLSRQSDTVDQRTRSRHMSNSDDSYRSRSGLYDHSRSRSRSYDWSRSRSRSYDWARSRSRSFDRSRSRSRSYDWSRSRSRSYDFIQRRYMRFYPHRSLSRSPSVYSEDGSRSLDRSNRSHTTSHRSSSRSTDSLRSRSRSYNYSRSRSGSQRSRSFPYSSHSSVTARSFTRSLSRSSQSSRSRSRSTGSRSVSSNSSSTVISYRSRSYSRSRSITPQSYQSATPVREIGSSAGGANLSSQGNKVQKTSLVSKETVTKTDIDSTETESDAGYNFKRRKSKGNNSNSNSDSGIGTELSPSQNQNRVNTSNNEANGSHSSTVNKDTCGSIGQRKRKTSATNCDKGAKRMCLDEENVEQHNSDDDKSETDASWEPSVDDIDTDETISDEASSGSSYTVHIPKSTMNRLAEYDSQESDDTWTPDTDN